MEAENKQLTLEGVILSTLDFRSFFLKDMHKSYLCATRVSNILESDNVLTGKNNLRIEEPI